MEPLLLHGHAISPNPHKVAIALQYLQIPYEVKIWEFGDDPRRGVKGEDFVKISPNGRVPAVQDSNTGVTVWESGAIINYLKRRYDRNGILGPKGPGLQDQVDLEQWEYLLSTTLGPMSGQVAWFRYYNVEKNDDALERYTKQVYHYYDVLEGQLERSGGNSILPGGITSVDCHYEPWIRPFEYIGLSLDKHPKVQKWLSLMAQQQPLKDAYQSIKDATALQDPASAERGYKPDESLLREIQIQTDQS